MLKCIATCNLKYGTQRNDARQIVYQRKDFLKETETRVTNFSIIKETVIDLLMGIALANMTSFYSVIPSKTLVRGAT